jgi:hypothetical protein
MTIIVPILTDSISWDISSVLLYSIVMVVATVLMVLAVAAA